MAYIKIIKLLVLGLVVTCFGILVKAQDSSLELLNSDEPFRKSKKNIISILVYPADKKINWESPGSLVRSVFWNTLKRDSHPLSHMDVFLRCEGAAPVLSGMSREKTWRTYADILWRGQSLNLLTGVFLGKFLSQEHIMTYLKPAIQNGRVRAVSFELNAQNCLRLLGYYHEYNRREYHKLYSGFSSNVYAGEGAGCAAYGVSFLKVAGLLSDELQSVWTRNLFVPEELLSHHTVAPSVWSYVFGFDGAWAKDKEPKIPLLIYDPEKIFDWIDEQTHWRFVSPIRSRVYFVQKAIELNIDGSEVLPVDDYWKYNWP